MDRPNDGFARESGDDSLGVGQCLRNDPGRVLTLCLAVLRHHLHAQAGAVDRYGGEFHKIGQHTAFSNQCTGDSCNIVPPKQNRDDGRGLTEYLDAMLGECAPKRADCSK